VLGGQMMSAMLSSPKGLFRISIAGGLWAVGLEQPKRQTPRKAVATHPDFTVIFDRFMVPPPAQGLVTYLPS
jgi:hypothetical protein